VKSLPHERHADEVIGISSVTRIYAISYRHLHFLERLENGNLVIPAEQDFVYLLD
jgi:hypothetical protein